MVSLKAGNWAALSDHVKSGRAKMDLTQRQLAEMAGVSFATIQSIERAEPRTRLPDSIPKVEIALGWPAGTARKIVWGEQVELDPEEVRDLLEALDRGGASERAKRFVAEYLDGPN